MIPWIFADIEIIIDSYSEAEDESMNPQKREEIGRNGKKSVREDT